MTDDLCLKNAYLIIKRIWTGGGGSCDSTGQTQADIFGNKNDSMNRFND